jgi:pyruvate kinase
MLRRTKIVATLGPATEDPKVLDKLLQAGADVVRLNFSHGNADEHRQRAETVRSRAAALGREVGVLVDLQGPKIRIDRFAEGKIELQEGAAFILDANCDPMSGNQERVGIAYKELVHDVESGDLLLLDDGRIELIVDKVVGGEIHCRVQVGGTLSNNKGINRKGGGLSAPALTDKDKEDIKTAAEIKADYVAVSFPRSAQDIHEARALLQAAGGYGAIVAKIERIEALDAIDEILQAADVIMIARGDLGVEIGDAGLPPVQKSLISKAREANRVVITATQMMESMITNQIPTRAEVFDVANSVFDGTDAVMLSAETAAGSYPVKAVEAMDRICLGAEQQRETRRSDHRINTRFERVDEAIAMAAMYTGNHLGVTAIGAMTESGSTPLWMSRISSGIPIFALTGQEQTRRKVTLYRGVYPINFNTMAKDHATANKNALEEMKRRGCVQDGDLVILTKGDLMGVLGGTNAMKILRVGEEIEPDTD